MLNYIWFGLMAIALVVAAINGTADAVTRGAVESASGAVQIAIGLVGIMTLWLGMMRVAEAAGLVTLVGRALRPILRWLFPEVPADHPAAGAIVLALAANMLGLNNAATPLGIKAMEELQELNPDKDTATNAMVTLMAITTAGVQFIPASMIGVLAAAGSTNPTAIIAPTIVATFIGTLAAIVAARLLQPFYPQPSGSDQGHEPGRFRDAHHAEPQRHDADEPNRDLHRACRRFDGATRDPLSGPVDGCHDERNRHETEPDVIQHGNLICSRWRE